MFGLYEGCLVSMRDVWCVMCMRDGWCVWATRDVWGERATRVYKPEGMFCLYEPTRDAQRSYTAICVWTYTAPVQTAAYRNSATHCAMSTAVELHHIDRSQGTLHTFEMGLPWRAQVTLWDSPLQCFSAQLCAV